MSRVDGAAREVVALAPPGEWDGHIVARADGTFATVAQGALEPLSVPVTQARELRSLLDLRDRARGLLAAEAASLQDTPELAVLRDGLRGAYSAYVERLRASEPVHAAAHRPCRRGRW